MRAKIKNILIYFTFFILILSGCQQTPTKIMQESIDPYGDRTVLVDTRSSFKYTSYHIEGSVNLESSSFLVIKNPKKRTHEMDTDLAQTIERLAKRGISPNKRVILLSDRSDDVENKKWNWLLNRLEVLDVQKNSIEGFKKELAERKRVDRFAIPDSVDPWVLKLSPTLQDELILKKSQDCFVNWSETKCIL